MIRLIIRHDSVSPGQCHIAKCNFFLSQKTLVVDLLLWNTFCVGKIADVIVQSVYNVLNQNKAALSLVISRTNQCTHVMHQTQDYLHELFSVSDFNFPA